MKPSLRLIAALSLLGLLGSGCSTIRMMKAAAARPTAPPDYREVKDFYFWGLKGEHHVYLADICGDRPATQIVRQQTLSNGLLAALTLGVYVPQTVMVWCEARK